MHLGVGILYSSRRPDNGKIFLSSDIRRSRYKTYILTNISDLAVQYREDPTPARQR
jgi:hypothetical protein